MIKLKFFLWVVLALTRLFRKGFSWVESEDFSSNVNEMCKVLGINFIEIYMAALQNIETEQTLEEASIIEPDATWK